MEGSTAAYIKICTINRYYSTYFETRDLILLDIVLAANFVVILLFYILQNQICC